MLDLFEENFPGKNALAYFNPALSDDKKFITLTPGLNP
jgi:hypothetical protein